MAETGERLPAIEALKEKAIRRLREVEGGPDSEGFKMLVTTARYLAVLEVCNALQKDFGRPPYTEGEER